MTLAAAGVAWAAPKGETGKPEHPAHPAKPAEPPATQAPATTAPAPSTTTTTKSAPTAAKPVKAAPTTGTTKDPRDPGSAQERGRGNSGDIDPYRGPDAPGNTPPQGNDCDEGGGNNRTTFPRRENTGNGDSDVDNDNGGGNNRCGALVSTPPGGPGGPGGPPGISTTPGQSQQPGGSPELGGILPEQTSGTTPDEAGTSPESPNGSDNPVVGVGPAKVRLPFTGAELLWLALLGGLFTAMGLLLRQRLTSHSPALATAIPAAIPEPMITPAPRPQGVVTTPENRAVRLMLLGAAAGGVALALRRFASR